MPAPSQARSLATLEKILTAAEAVVAKDGVGGLTMDRVAQMADISKGGVLHHFRSKEALITRIASRKLDLLAEELEQQCCLRGQEPHRMLAGMIEHAAQTYGKDDGFSRAMLVAAVENSQSLEKFRAMFANSFARVREESTDPDASVALLFAVIGLQASRSLGIAELDPAQAEAVFAALRRLTTSHLATDPA